MWQPIETAPKDGRWVLLFIPNCGYDGPYGGHLPTCGVVACKWIDGLTGWTTAGVSGISDATHWMPLPKSPENEFTEPIGLKDWNELRAAAGRADWLSVQGNFLISLLDERDRLAADWRTMYGFAIEPVKDGLLCKS